MTELSVLFVCIGNSCRSPMAEAMARQLGEGRVEALSAGLAPAGWVAARTVETLELMGYSGEGLSSKSLDDIELHSLDCVVSLLGEQMIDMIPTPAGAHRIAWPIYDPFGEDEAIYLDVARQIERRVKELIRQELDQELSVL